jgi:hypothetical protein
MIMRVLVDAFVLSRIVCRLNPVSRSREASGSLTQPSSQSLISNTAIQAVSHKRRHQWTDVIVLFPSSFRLFANQMKARGGNRQRYCGYTCRFLLIF